MGGPGTSSQRSPLRAYGLAVLGIALGLGARALMADLLGERAVFLLLIPAVLASAVYGGLGPGIAATLFGAAAGTWLWFEPRHELGPLTTGELLNLALFVAVGLGLAWFGDRLERSRRQLAADAEEIRRSAERYRLAERRALRLAADLELRVEQRTRALQEANEDLEAFASAASHDLRAPLRGLQGFAASLLAHHAGALDVEGREDARRIADAAARLEALIMDLLAYGRLGRPELKLEPVSLERAVDEARQRVAEEVRERGAEVSVARPLPEALAHHATLVQVIANLLANAVKFVAAGVRPVVSVSSDRADGRVRLLIDDNGIGIAPEDQERIFTPFERLHGVEAFPGTGIGLAIVRRGVERMGGRVGVFSQPGQGSLFWIELPAPESPPAPPSPATGPT